MRAKHKQDISDRTRSDKLLLRDYQCDADIGVFEHERAQRQRLIFNLTVALKTHAAIGDHIDTILSYDELVYAIDSSLAHKRYDLLETLGEAICARILTFSSVANVTLRIEKPDRVAGRLGIEIYRDTIKQMHVPISGDLPMVEIWHCAPVTQISAAFEKQLQNRTGAPVLCPSVVTADYSGTYGQRRVLYALAQAACELAQRWPDLRLSRKMAELRHALKNKQGQIWLPVDMILAANPAPNITPDSAELANWLASRFETAQVLTPDGKNG